MIPSPEQRVKEQRFRLNPQGLARKDKPLMRAVMAPPGETLVSCDLASGEPTCTTHYSGDKNYADATFNMVGKAPFYNPEGVLKIDNLYLTVMSVSPMGKALMRELFATKYGDDSFSSLWERNASHGGSPFQDYIKDQIKPQYAFHKIGTLGMGYAMGPKKFQNAAYDAGHVITFAQAKDFYVNYWTLFKGIKKFANVCANNFKARGFLVNEFGYRLMPDKEYKAFNYWIQSTVSGIMHVLCAKFFALAPYCRFLLVIHDEVIFSCPTGRLEEARLAMKQAEASLNRNLNWRVNMRVGWATGLNLYDAK